MLINSHHKVHNILALKRLNRKKILIHRVDGPIQVVRDIDTGLDNMIFSLNKTAADATVFQSEWSRHESYNRGLKKNRFETTIMNAPDPSIFNKDKKIPFNEDRKVRLIGTSWSNNWRKGFRFYQWMDNNLDFTNYRMTFIGNSPIKYKNIRSIPPLRSDALAEELKKNDIYIAASHNDPCSNALIEAMHCGLPSIALNEGGHPEIIGDAGELFSRPDEIPKLLTSIAHNYQTYQSKIRLPTINDIGQKYYEFIHSIYKNVQSRGYEPKQVTLKNYSIVLSALIRWKIFERISSLKTHLFSDNR